MDVRSDIFPGTPDGFHPRDVSVRLARPDERIRWDRLMDQHHYLGFKRFAGHGVRYVFDWRGQWVGLAGWQSGAFKCRPRDQWIGWKRELQFTRMHLIANNTRFLILGAPGCFPNLASLALAAMVQRLSADWSAAYGHSLLLAETFVDPSKFCGYMYKAAGWTQLGRTKGYARANGRYTDPHGVLKDLHVFPLHRDTRSRMCAPDPLPDPLLPNPMGDASGQPPHGLNSVYEGNCSPRYAARSYCLAGFPPRSGPQAHYRNGLCNRHHRPPCWLRNRYWGRAVCSGTEPDRT